jgi:signal transduction histidine kinase/DNA-binding response OmpR family regulator
MANAIVTLSDEVAVMRSASRNGVGRPPLLSDLPLAGGFMLLVCCAMSGVWLFWLERNADAWVQHTLQVEDQLSQVQIEGLTAAVDIRTSILAGREGADIDIKKIRRSYFAHIDELRALTRDNPSQQKRLSSLRSISDRRFDMLEQAVSERRAGRISEAARLIADPKTQAIVLRARAEMDQVRAEEVRLFQQRKIRADSIERFASGVLAASMLLTLLLAFSVLPERRARIRALWTTKRELEAALEAKRSFLANMSHEIRTPMNGVLGFTELLLGDELTVEQRKRAELIDSSGRAMMRLLNDILDFSKIEAGQMRIAHEPFDLPHAIQACVKLMSPAASRKELILDCEISDDLPNMVVGDGLRLRQIILNLLGNAVKFTEQGGIAVRAFGNESSLVLEVRDTGIGIAPDRQTAIFEDFVQADSGIATRFGGTGLGLSITMQLVRMMSGTLELESEPARGSMFRVTIPIEAASAEVVVADLSSVRLAEVPVSHRERILLAEDHDVNQELFMGMLSQLGWRADLASNGAEAIHMVKAAELRGDPYRLVLMDMQMPVMDGLEATRRIRASGLDGHRLPILALTANGYDSDVAACFAAGSQAHLAKPIKMADLDRALRTWASSGSDQVAEPTVGASIRKRYEQRKVETLEALDQLVRRGRFSNEDLTMVADLLHKLAGTAAMFGEAQLGDRARDLEDGIERWTEAERDAKIRDAVTAIRKAA